MSSCSPLYMHKLKKLAINPRTEKDNCQVTRHRLPILNSSDKGEMSEGISCYCVTGLAGVHIHAPGDSASTGAFVCFSKTQLIKKWSLHFSVKV